MTTAATPTRASGEGSLLRHDPLRLSAEAGRVVLRPFDIGWTGDRPGEGRAEKLVERVRSLEPERAARELSRIMGEFHGRHWRTELVFDERFAVAAQEMGLDADAIPVTVRRLIGAYFCNEYSYAAAAVTNPSIAPHPDQSGLSPGCVRFILSLRTVGEGHISSIAFREGIAEADGSFDLWPPGDFATTAVPVAQDGDTMTVQRQRESTLSQTVLFPVTGPQAGGLEDLRLLRFEHSAGDYEWIGTYTAYSGSTIRSELLRTRDFRRFTMEPIEGAPARSKGMAPFPRCIGGRFAAIGRQDGVNLYLLRSDRLDQWDGEGALLLEPRYPWEFTQIGNCGPPIETDHGWLLLTHGVGAMRKYALGAALLDRDDPSRVLARTPRPILSAAEDDRAGYVPNVVYTCGALKVGERLLIPYGIADSSVGFASAAIDDLVAAME